MNEKEKMLAGKVYDCMYPELDNRRLEMSKLCIQYNSLPDGHPDRKKLLKEIFPEADETFLCVDHSTLIMVYLPKLVKTPILTSI